MCLWGEETQPRMRAVHTTRVLASQTVQGSTLRRKKECVYEFRLLLCVNSMMSSTGRDEPAVRAWLLCAVALLLLDPTESCHEVALEGGVAWFGVLWCCVLC